ncbi:HK97-gp10 family putative phage morphogenesis protein [Brevundimonas pondensis]|uniref:HK97 gp10 family phage protein n=1 Tax=Brevundimonas pondensis TaxID=2774189 RepID=A0ABX7SPA4_9CAUL|nr:HK97-gp10 family putative phage morphogenesis protein [Brevundimonas pondensis]QTC88186.1 HK97 gp10 family phage protein [Brevundimonas pondensis]
MARGGAFRIAGLREVNAALGQLPKATGRNVLRRVAIARLEPIAEAMRQNAPVHLSDLKDSVAVTTKRPKRHRKVSEVEAFAGPGRHPQAHLQEFGTSQHGPQPFARPAWDEGKGDLLPGVGEDLWAEIDKAAARLARKTARLAAKGR